MNKPDPKATLKRIFELSAEVTRLGTETRRTVSTAESCTGGLIGAALTAIPGSSAVFRGGIIAYDNSVKVKLLDVPPGMIHKYGAVSREVARAMAGGAIEKLNVDIAVSVTGIAGPGGGSEEKPVGTVWMGLSQRQDGELITEAKLHNFSDMSRNKVRDMTCLAALEALIDALKP